MPDLKLLLLTSIPYGPYSPASKPDDGPDRHAVVRALAALGIEMHVIDPYPFPWNPLAGRHPLLQSLDPLRTLRALRLARHYDFVISGNDGPAVLLVLLRRLFRLRARIVVWDLSPAEKWRLRAWLQDVTLPKVDGIIAVPYVQETYIRARWGEHLRIAALGYFIDTDFYRPQAAAPGNYVLAVGDDPGRDYLTLLAATQRLDLELRIKTSLPLVADPQGRAQIKLISGRLPYTEFRSLYAESTFVVVPLHPHTRNASGFSALLEAGAMGKAIIVSDSDGIRGFVKPGETCLMVPAGDADALAAAITRLQREPETCRRLGENARQWVETQFSPAAFARRFADAVRGFRRQ